MPMDLRDETLFWTRQFSEHLGFLGEMLQGPLRDEAIERHAEYEALRQSVAGLDGGTMAAAVEDATRSVHAFQTSIGNDLDDGAWLGFAWPLFVDHITREVELYQHLAYGDPGPVLGIPAAVSQMGGEHALFAANLIDPSVRAASTVARATGWKLISMSEKEQSRGRLLGEIALQKTVKQFVETTGLGTPSGTKSLVSPTLREHVLREQVYYSGKLEDALREQLAVFGR